MRGAHPFSDAWSDAVFEHLDLQIQVVLKLSRYAQMREVLEIDMHAVILPASGQRVRIYSGAKEFIFPRNLWIEAEMEHCSRRICYLKEGSIVPHCGPMFWIFSGRPLRLDHVIEHLLGALAMVNRTPCDLSNEGDLVPGQQTSSDQNPKGRHD